MSKTKSKNAKNKKVKLSKAEPGIFTKPKVLKTDNSGNLQENTKAKP